MKARFQRALALLLVLVLTLGCIPAVSAVQPEGRAAATGGGRNVVPNSREQLK